MCFEGNCYLSIEIVSKAREEAHSWFLAQEVIAEQQKLDDDLERREVCRWQPPPATWDKCNIGVPWSEALRLAGGAWVLRNYQGKALIHGRRAFSSFLSHQEASFVVT